MPKRHAWRGSRGLPHAVKITEFAGGPEVGPEERSLKSKSSNHSLVTSWWFQPIAKILVKLDHFLR